MNAERDEETTDTVIEIEIDTTTEERDDIVQALLIQDHETREEDVTILMKTEREEEDDTQVQAQTSRNESDTETTPETETEDENEILPTKDLQLETALMTETQPESQREKIHPPEDQCQLKDLPDEEILQPTNLQEPTPLKTDDQDQTQDQFTMTKIWMLKIKDLRLI